MSDLIEEPVSGEVIPAEVQSSEQPVVPVQYNTDPAAVVDFTQKLRYRMVYSLTENGTKIPTDTKELSALLRDMDTSALTTRKLNIEESNKDDPRELIAMAHELKRIFNGKSPLLAEEPRQHNPLEGVDIPEVEISELEALQGEQTLEIRDYVSE